MATATPTPTATAHAAPSRTRKIDVEVHDEQSAADLLGMSMFVFRGRSIGDLPGISRSGSNYFVTADYAHRLRQIRGGVPTASVWRDELEANERARWLDDKPTREAIAKADAKCAAEKAEREAENQKLWDERQAIDEKRKQAMYAATSDTMRRV